MNIRVKDILDSKRWGYVFISPEATVKEAIDKIAKGKIGALLVIKDDKLSGIISERDILKLVASYDEDAFLKPVKDYMTKNLVVGVPDDDIDIAMAYMTNNRFRHLPIVENRRICGIISIGDIIKAEVQNLKVEKRYLTEYITGNYPG